MSDKIPEERRVALSRLFEKFDLGSTGVVESWEIKARC